MKITILIACLFISSFASANDSIIKQLFYGIELSKNIEKTKQQLEVDSRFAASPDTSQPLPEYLYRGKVLENKVLGHATDLSIICLQTGISKSICSDCNRKPVTRKVHTTTVWHYFPSEKLRDNAYQTLVAYLKSHNLTISFTGKVERIDHEEKFSAWKPNLSVEKDRKEYAFKIALSKYFR